MRRWLPWVQALLIASVPVVAIIKIDNLEDWKKDAQARIEALEKKTSPTADH